MYRRKMQAKPGRYYITQSSLACRSEAGGSIRLYLSMPIPVAQAYKTSIVPETLQLANVMAVF